MKRKFSSTLAAVALSAAFTLHLTDQAARHVQESSLFLPPAPASCPMAPLLLESPGQLPSGGLGAMIEAEPRGARIISLLPGHSAAKAGLRLGDRIVAVDGESTLSRSTSWSVQRLRGKIGTPVTLEVERGEGLWQRTFQLTLQRQQLDTSHSVYSRVRDGELTLRILWLDSGTAEQVSEHLAQASRGDVTSVVLDLQHVGHGDASAVADVASLFLPKGSAVGYMVSDRQEVKSVSGPLTTHGYPVTDQLNAVQVGPFTARSGELLARALVDHLGVEVRGAKTAGLGTLDGRTIKSRTATSGGDLFLLDSQGRSIEGNPLKPSFWSWSHLLSPVPTGLE